MSEFLTGTALTDKIREIVGGKNVKCAVAYWGDHRFKTPKDCKIVCDIVGGSTSGHALKNLGAPNNRNLKHVEDLHAKVYISDRGVVVGSANASARGLGDGGHYRPLLEAGTFHKHEGKVWAQAVEWFDELFKGARFVDQAAVNLAESRYRPPIGDRPTTFEGLTVLQQIVADPDYFSRNGIGFVICRAVAEEDDVAEAVLQAVESGVVKGVTADTLSGWEAERCFIGWPGEEMEKIEPRFIEFFFKAKGGSKNVLAHTYVHRFDEVGHFYTREADPIITLPDGVKFPSGGKDALSDDDWRTLIQAGKLLKSKDGDGIFRAHDFAGLLRQALEQTQSQPKIG